jgi:hypothetical protein
MRKSLALAMVLSSLLVSCNKDDDKAISYLPLNIGNYWIYQEYLIDTAGTETLNTVIDSVIINRDTIINDKKYYVFEGNVFWNRHQRGIYKIVRDSSGYIIDQNGMVLFAENDFADTIAYKAVINPGDSDDTLYISTFRMERITESITVPAGTFNVLNCRNTVNTSMDTPDVKYPRYLKNYYSEGVGLILFNYCYMQSPTIYEERLIRYSVK